MLTRTEFTAAVLRHGRGKVTYEHARNCPRSAICDCSGKPEGRHCNGCASVRCNCDGIFHGIGLKGQEQ